MREMRWTDQQAAAITAHGHVLLAASAGTGKTTTVVGKILWLLGLDVGVRDSDGEPLPRCPEPCQLEEIAAITFTEKAAYDLKGKLRKEIERSEGAEALRWEIDRASIGTIHAFCGELLRDHSLRLGIDPTFRVLDERETTLQQEEIVRDVLMTALEARDPLAVSLVKRFHLNRRGRARGAVDQVVGVLRDVRWSGPPPAAGARGRPGRGSGRPARSGSRRVRLLGGAVSLCLPRAAKVVGLAGG
jgi:ATP-dependent exoDNAse (exonuclease V) beta subunit